MRPRMPSALFLAAVLVVLVLAGCGGTAQQPKPTPTATTVNPNASAPTYMYLVLNHLSTLSTAVVTAGPACDAVDIQGCRTGVQSIHDETAAFQAALDQNPAPPCLQEVDKLLRNSLTDLHDGATLATQGIDHNSASEIEAGGTKITEAGNHLNEAGDAMSNAKC